MSDTDKPLARFERASLEGIDVGLVTIDNPPINAGSRAMRADLLAAVREASASKGLAGVVVFGANGNFVGGADIREFDAPAEPPHLPEVIAAIEACPMPVVAAIDGAALGGGYELALGCDARVATPRAVVGLPEVTLGLIPGAGGTLRLSRLVGIAETIQLVTSGRRVRAREAMEKGMIDTVVDGGLLLAAAKYLTFMDGKKRVLRDLPPLASEACDIKAAETDARRRAAGSIAVEEAIAAVHASASLPADQALAEERATSLRLRIGDQSKALRHLFFAQRAALKSSSEVRPVPVERVGVVGAGQMGRGIALAFASRGYDVCVADSNEDFLAKATETLSASIDELAKKGRIASAEETRAKLRSGPIESMADRDLVIEAITEDMAAKKDLFAALDRLVRPTTILASNTSYLDIDELAAAVGNPERVGGLHFFNPANVMRLVEVIRTRAMSPQTEATLLAVAKRLGKVPVIVAKVSEGFIGNRIFSAYRRQCEFLVEEGAMPEDVDRAMRDFGMAMGPFAVFDLAGLDIAWATRKRLAPTRDPRARYVGIADRLCEMGRFGRKSGAGWYDYASSARGEPDPVVRKLIAEESAVSGIERRTISAGEIQSRLHAAMANEAALLLGEGVALYPSDIDLVLVHGYGFPAVKGGPLHFAARRPRSEILLAVDDMADKSGFGVEPASNLKDVLDAAQ